MTFRLLFTTLTLVSFSGCATVRIMKEVKLLGYSENASVGKTLGATMGSSCGWNYLGYQASSPNYQLSLNNARSGKLGEASDALGGEGKGISTGLRYMNNVKIDTEVSAFFVATKACYVTTAMGYK